MNLERLQIYLEELLCAENFIEELYAIAAKNDYTEIISAILCRKVERVEKKQGVKQ